MTEKEKDPKRVAAGKKSKRKGPTFERLVVRKLLDAGFDEAKRGWWQSGEFARFAGKKSEGAKPRVPDVFLDGFWLECGTGENMDTHRKLDQAIGDCPKADNWQTAIIPVSIVRKKGQRVILATMLLIDFERILAKICRAEQPTRIAQLNSIRVSLRLEEFIELVNQMRKSESDKEKWECPDCKMLKDACICNDSFTVIGEE